MTYHNKALTNCSRWWLLTVWPYWSILAHYQSSCYIGQCSCLPRTVLVYTCSPGIIVYNFILKKCPSSNDKLYCHTDLYIHWHKWLLWNINYHSCTSLSTGTRQISNFLLSLTSKILMCILDHSKDHSTSAHKCAIGKLTCRACKNPGMMYFNKDVIKVFSLLDQKYEDITCLGF